MAELITLQSNILEEINVLSSISTVIQLESVIYVQEQQESHITNEVVLTSIIE